MAATWGYAEIETHVDGSALPREIAREAQAAARDGGKAFTVAIRKEMRLAGRAASREFGRALKDMLDTLILSSGAMRRLYQGTIVLRRGFKTLGAGITDFTKNSLNKVTKGFREFGDSIRRDQIKTMAELREGFRAMKPSLDDWERSFPLVANAIRRTTVSVRGFTQSLRESGQAIRDDQIKVMRDMREGFRAMVPTVDDLEKSFPRLVRSVRATGRGFRFLGREIKSLGPDMDFLRPATSKLADTFLRLTRTVRTHFNVNKAFRSALKETTTDIDRETVATERNIRTKREGVSGLRKFLSNWKRLPHGFRQAVFWTGLVITAMGTLSVLTSALSGTIVALVTILGGLATGAGLAVAGFSGLYAENAKLTAGAQASKDALSELGGAFRELQGVITNNMFANMADSISNITNTLLPALESNIAAFASNVGENLGRIFDALSSPAGIENFKALIDGFGPIFTSMTDAVIGFGGALANILIASLPTAQAFADAIGDVGQRFLEWTASEEGRARLEQFFDTAERIMPQVVDLVVALSDALAGLVTETTISGTETFINALIDFMPTLGEIVNIISNLNVFGILAAALQTIGALIEPLIEPLSEFATILGTILIEGLQSLMPYVDELGRALAPVLEVIIAIATAALPPLITIIQDAIQYITEWVEILVGAEAGSEEFEQAIEIMGQVVGTTFEVLGNIIGTIMDGAILIFGTVAKLLRGDFTGAFKTMYDTTSRILERFGVNIDDVIDWFDDLWNTVRDVWNNITNAISTAVREIGNFLRDLFRPIQDAINWFNNLFGAASQANGASSRGGGGGGSQAFASGGILLGPRRILAGEAGPEAIVPLHRPLFQVDPSVRAISAFAQGMSGTQAMASGGVVGNGRTVNIESGAFPVLGNHDPERPSLLVLNRLAERIAG